MRRLRSPFAVAVLAASLSSPFARCQDAGPLPALADATVVHASASGERLAWERFVESLKHCDAVFLGETHLDDTTHRVELQVLVDLLKQREGKVVLSLEMFERDVQPVLDDYLRSAIDEATFLARSRPWGNYTSDYRPMIEAAKAAGIPVVAANFPATLRRKFAGGNGKEALEKLSPAERAFVPETILPASEGYWQRVDRATRGHMGGGPATAEERLYDGQNLWDNAMGEAVAKALAAHPGHVVLHVAGGFHTAFHDGTFAQFRARAKDAKAVTVQIAATGALHHAQPKRDADEADYVVYAQAIARSEFEDTHAVTIPSELRYRLHLPGAASTKAPLLVWLPESGSDARDALALWAASIGDTAAVAVVEHAFPQTQEDLGNGGRWNSGDGFRADYGAVQHGLEQMVEYLVRRQSIDPARVLVAGRGEGGAVVLWASLYSSWLPTSMLAVEPSDLSRLSMEGLPDKPPSMRGLVIAAGDAQKAKLEKIASDYRGVGAKVDLEAPLDGQGLVQSVRSRLALPALAVSTAPDSRRFVVLQNDSPRARQWGELHAAHLRVRGLDARVVTASELAEDTPREQVVATAVGGLGWPMEAFTTGFGLPLAGGSFGGTTLLVLPKGATQRDFDGLKQLEANKVIKRRSPFANLAIARWDAEPTLPQTIASLKQKGRSRVLVVPFVFCATVDEMQDLKRQLGDAAQGMDLQWLPGVGAELAR